VGIARAVIQQRELAKEIAARGVFVVPTLSMFATIAPPAVGPSLVADADLAPYLSAADRATLERSNPPAPGRSMATVHTSTLALRRAGVAILAGTDAAGNSGVVPGASLHGELALLVAAGLRPAEALAAATSAPARAFGLADRGRIAPGRRADLVLVEGDPTRDIRATRRIAGVWIRGAPVDRESHRVALAPAGGPAGSSAR